MGERGNDLWKYTDNFGNFPVFFVTWNLFKCFPINIFISNASHKNCRCRNNYIYLRSELKELLCPRKFLSLSYLLGLTIHYYSINCDYNMLSTLFCICLFPIQKLIPVGCVVGVVILFRNVFNDLIRFWQPKLHWWIRLPFNKGCCI